MSLALKNAKSAEGEVEAAAAAYLQFGRSYPAKYAIMFAGELATHSCAGEMLLIANRCLDLVRASIADTGKLGPAEIVEAAFCAWSLLHGILMLDQNAVLQESHAEQKRLATKGVLAIMNGLGAGGGPNGGTPTDASFPHVDRGGVLGHQGARRKRLA
jgi:hypothetical protein